MNPKEQKFIDELKRDGYEVLTEVSVYYYASDHSYSNCGHHPLVGKPFGNILLFKMVDAQGIFDITVVGKKEIKVGDKYDYEYVGINSLYDGSYYFYNPFL